MANSQHHAAALGLAVHREEGLSVSLDNSFSVAVD